MRLIRADLRKVTARIGRKKTGGTKITSGRGTIQIDILTVHSVSSRAIWLTLLRMTFKGTAHRLDNLEHVGSGKLTTSGSFHVSEGTTAAMENLAKGSINFSASAGCFVTPSGAFGNQLAKRYAAELTAAKKVKAPIVRFGDKAFEQVVNTGTIKFVITEKGELIIAPKFVNGVEISHAVLAGGNAVRAAGEAEIAGTASQFIGLGIRPHSGHYLKGATAEQSDACIALAREAFKKLGIIFPDL